MVAAPDPLQRIPHLYHFTDVVNLPNIRRLDGLLSTAKLREMGESFCAGGDDSSLSLDKRHGMDQFVHLCFRERHPMAGRIKERKPETSLVYLEIDRAILHQPGVKFATGIAYAQDVETVMLNEAVERSLIDVQSLYSWTDWKDPEAQRRRRSAELCEILIPDYIPMAFIRNIPHG